MSAAPPSAAHKHTADDAERTRHSHNFRSAGGGAGNDDGGTDDCGHQQQQSTVEHKSYLHLYKIAVSIPCFVVVCFVFVWFCLFARLHFAFRVAASDGGVRPTGARDRNTQQADEVTVYRDREWNNNRQHASTERMYKMHVRFCNNKNPLIIFFTIPGVRGWREIFSHRHRTQRQRWQSASS